MADLRIVDAPVLLQESITDDVKMPTGGLGNFSIRLGDILWYVITKEQLANKSYVDLSSKGVQDSLDEHIADKANPHNVTKAQVGLGNVDNTADIDKPVSNATKSAIITATTDMTTKSYVNSKDGDLTALLTTDKTNLVKAINEVVSVKADKATKLVGYGISDAYTKSEIDTNYGGVKTLYDKNVAAAGAGANGWDDTLVAAGENLNQRQVNDGLDSVAQLAGIKNPRNGQRVYVKSYHAGQNKGGGTFVYDATKANINDGGIIINGWVRQFDRTYVLVEWFGAKSYGDGDSTDAFQKAIDFAQSQPTNMEVHLSSYTYEVGTIHIKNSTRRMVSIVGTYNGYASALAFDFYNNNAGSVILHNGTGKSVLFDVDNTAYHNGQVQFRYIGIVGNYWQPDTQTEGTIAIRINKAAKDNPDGNGYRIGHIFEQVAFVNCFYPIVFTSELSPPTYNFLNNHVGDVILNRCSCYTGKSFFVAENTTLNRLMIQNSFIFALSGQAIITKQLDGIDERYAAYSPCALRMKLSDTHFEGVRGMFDLRQTGKYGGESVRSHVEISNVTRESSSVYETGTGSALGFIHDVDFLITGRFEDVGWNEQNEIRFPVDCTIQSAIKLNPALEGINCNKSPYNINTRTDTRTLANGATKGFTLVVTDDFGVLDVDLNLKFSNTNNQQLGLNTYNISGLQSNRKLIKSESTDPNITVVDNVVSAGSIISFNITNNTGADLVITSQVTKNVYGARYWIYFG